MSTPPRFLGSVHTEYPDDNSVKEVTLHAAGYEISPDRHVLLQWLNGTKDEVPVTQIVQLTGQAGNYNYYAPVVTCTDTNIRNQDIPVGTFSRAQRDQILRLSNQVKFQTTSIINNCRVWLRELLVAMVDEELITQEKFDEIIQVDPLQMPSTRGMIAMSRGRCDTCMFRSLRRVLNVIQVDQVGNMIRT